MKNMKKRTLSLFWLDFNAFLLLTIFSNWITTVHWAGWSVIVF